MTQLRLVPAGLSDVGRQRDHNEDAVLVGERVVAVADGLGGHAAGEVASGLAVEALSAVDAAVDPDDPAAAQQTLRDAVAAANAAVRESANADPERAGMGTTMTAAAVAAGRVCLAHVGDSRAYLLRDGDLRQLTDDHSHVADLVRAGDITPAEARVHPHRAVITRALGLDDTVEVDTPEPVELVPGDVLLLCSDGLTEPLTDTEIRGILSSGDAPEVAARALIEAANAAGGPDNITVVVAAVEPA